MTVKTVINMENRTEVTEIFAFVQSLDDEKRKAFSSFVDGAKFMQNLMSAAGGQTAVRASG